MTTMDDAAFLAWLAEGGIGNGARLPGRWHPSFADAKGLTRTWDAPDDAAARRRWLETIVDAASADGPWWLRRRYGPEWRSDGAPEMERAATAAGVPPGFAGALGFDASERETMTALLASFATWTWGMGEDLYLFPADRSCIVHLCHDEEVHVSAATRERLDAFAAAMTDRPPRP